MKTAYWEIAEITGQRPQFLRINPNDRQVLDAIFLEHNMEINLDFLLLPERIFDSEVELGNFVYTK